MVLKLDVRNVDEESLTKTNLVSADGSGFSIRFTTVGSGMVPLKYGFDMVFIFKDDEPGYCLDDIEVEIWDNNIIVQVSQFVYEHCATFFQRYQLRAARCLTTERVSIS
jgi:hypothetical protein